MPDKNSRKPRHRRTAADVMNSQNVLIVRKIVQEGLIPSERIAALIREFDPTVQKAAQ